MRKMVFCGVVLCGIGMHAALAQTAMGGQQQSIGSNQSVMAAILEPTIKAPYQAEKVSRSKQTLSDGTVIVHEWKGMIARDAEGRVREDLNMTHSGDVNGRQMDMVLQSATVGDPLTNKILIWTGDKTKIAVQMQLPSLPKGTKTAMGAILSGPPPPPSMLRPKAVALGTASGVGATGVRDDVRTEDLGQQSIEGVLVTGKRITTTIPTGKIGNDRPIIVVHEEWRSPELKILVKTMDSDPRTGEQTMELQGVVRTDPDAALFQAPPGYKVQDMADMMKGLGNIGRAAPQ
jgi:hypothetical protein